MRIISQNGVDFPYESIAISCGDGMIYARPVSDMEKTYVLARYSSEEKAEKAMQMLHDCYSNCRQTELFYLKGVDTEYPNYYFRFPQEDEI